MEGCPVPLQFPAGSSLCRRIGRIGFKITVIQNVQMGTEMGWDLLKKSDETS